MKLKFRLHALRSFEGKAGYFLFSSDMSEYGYIFIDEIEVEIPEEMLLTDAELVAGTIDVMKREQARIMAEAHKRTAQIEGNIQRLLCLECKGGE